MTKHIALREIKAAELLKKTAELLYKSCSAFYEKLLSFLFFAVLGICYCSIRIE